MADSCNPDGESRLQLYANMEWRYARARSAEDEPALPLVPWS